MTWEINEINFENRILFSYFFIFIPAFYGIISLIHLQHYASPIINDYFTDDRLAAEICRSNIAANISRITVFPQKNCEINVIPSSVSNSMKLCIINMLTNFNSSILILLMLSFCLIDKYRSNVYLTCFCAIAYIQRILLLFIFFLWFHVTNNVEKISDYYFINPVIIALLFFDLLIITRIKFFNYIE